MQFITFNYIIPIIKYWIDVLSPAWRINNVSDVLSEGQEVKVKCVGVDDRGKVKLSMKVVNQETGEEIIDEPKEEAQEQAS